MKVAVTKGQSQTLLLPYMKGNSPVEAEETDEPQSSDVQELSEKLQMVQEELERVRADLTRQMQ